MRSVVPDLRCPQAVLSHTVTHIHKPSPLLVPGMGPFFPAPTQRQRSSEMLFISGNQARRRPLHPQHPFSSSAPVPSLQSQAPVSSRVFTAFQLLFLPSLLSHFSLPKSQYVLNNTDHIMPVLRIIPKGTEEPSLPVRAYEALHHDHRDDVVSFATVRGDGSASATCSAERPLCFCPRASGHAVHGPREPRAPCTPVSQRPPLGSNLKPAPGHLQSSYGQPLKAFPSRSRQTRI